jgi:hypothetical protein
MGTCHSRLQQLLGLCQASIDVWVGEAEGAWVIPMWGQLAWAPAWGVWNGVQARAFVWSSRR